MRQLPPSARNPGVIPARGKHKQYSLGDRTVRSAAALIWIVAALLIACSSESTSPPPSSRERDEHRCKTVVGNDNHRAANNDNRHRNHTGSACPFRDGRAAQSSDANSSARGTARNGNSANRHAPGTYGDGDHHHGSARDRVSSPSHAAGLRPPRLETLDRRRPGLPRCPQRGTDCRKPHRSCLSNRQEVPGDDRRMAGPVQQCHRLIQANSTSTTWCRWATRTTAVPGTGRPIGESNTPTTWTILSISSRSPPARTVPRVHEGPRTGNRKTAPIGASTPPTGSRPSTAGRLPPPKGSMTHWLKCSTRARTAPRYWQESPAKVGRGRIQPVRQLGQRRHRCRPQLLRLQERTAPATQRRRSAKPERRAAKAPAEASRS